VYHHPVRYYVLHGSRVVISCHFFSDLPKLIFFLRRVGRACPSTNARQYEFQLRTAVHELMPGYIEGTWQLAQIGILEILFRYGCCSFRIFKDVSYYFILYDEFFLKRN